MEVSTSNELQPLGEASIQKMIEKLQEDCELEQHLPGGGYLHMSDELPYLVVYRVKDREKDEDRATVRFVLSEASFLILGDEDWEGYQRLIYCLSEAMSSKFKSFLLLELFAGEPESNEFRIKGPADRLPATLKVLKKELDLLNKNYQVLNLDPATIEDTEDRHPAGERPLLEISKLKDAGCPVSYTHLTLPTKRIV